MPIYGEEFLLILAETTIAGAHCAAELLRQGIAATEFPTAGPVTASFGVCEFCPGEGAESLLRRVDSALYASKTAGRNRTTQG